MATYSGVVLDVHGLPQVRSIRFYRRDTGALLGSTISDPVSGAYTFDTAYTDETQVVLINSLMNSTENDQIMRALPV